MLPVAARRGDKSGDSGYSETVADDAATLDAEACHPERQQTLVGQAGALVEEASESRKKVGNAIPPAKYPVPERRCQFGIQAPAITLTGIDRS
jgi:hypothetical protein